MPMPFQQLQVPKFAQIVKSGYQYSLRLFLKDGSGVLIDLEPKTPIATMALDVFDREPLRAVPGVEDPTAALEAARTVIKKLARHESSCALNKWPKQGEAFAPCDCAVGDAIEKLGGDRP